MSFWYGFPDKNDVSMLKVLRTIQTEIGNTSGTTVKAFRVRKKAVLLALKFLKKHNPQYYDIVIDMSSLDWIEGDEGILDGQEIGEGDVSTFLDTTHQNSDMGPAPRQAVQPRKEGDDITAFGYIDTGAKAPLPERDQIINDSLQQVVDNSPVKKNIANNTSDGGITTEQLERALDWANTTTIDYDSLHSRVKLYIQRKVQKRHHVVGEQSSFSNISKRQRVQ